MLLLLLLLGLLGGLPAAVGLALLEAHGSCVAHPDLSK